jgi:hypothetical protein
MISKAALEGRARRAAQRIGLTASKSRWRRDTVDNYGGFQLLDLYTNNVVDGYRFDLTAAAVLDYCSRRVAEKPWLVEQVKDRLRS